MGARLELPRRGILTSNHNLCFSGKVVLTSTLNLCFRAKIRKIYKKILLKVFNVYNFRQICIYHGRVFVMYFMGVFSLCPRIRALGHFGD